MIQRAQCVPGAGGAVRAAAHGLRGRDLWQPGLPGRPVLPRGRAHCPRHPASAARPPTRTAPLTARHVQSRRARGGPDVRTISSRAHVRTAGLMSNAFEYAAQAALCRNDSYPYYGPTARCREASCVVVRRLRKTKRGKYASASGSSKCCIYVVPNKSRQSLFHIGQHERAPCSIVRWVIQSSRAARYGGNVP